MPYMWYNRFGMLICIYFIFIFVKYVRFVARTLSNDYYIAYNILTFE